MNKDVASRIQVDALEISILTLAEGLEQYVGLTQAPMKSPTCERLLSFQTKQMVKKDAETEQSLESVNDLLQALTRSSNKIPRRAGL